MKICVTSEGKTQDSRVDPRFGRCGYFIIFETETVCFEPFENAGAQFQGGAGIQSGKFLVSKGVDVLLTGNVGPNAYQVLSAAGIRVFTGVSGTVAEAIGRYQDGEYSPAQAPTASSKSGMPRN